MEGVPHDYALSVRVEVNDAAPQACKAVVSVVPPVISAPLPTTFICAIDISGSMGYAVASGAESLGFSRLDLVKHCLNTMLAMMDEQHSLCLVAFSNQASVLLPTTRMDEPGRDRARTVIANLRPTGGTNLWSAMEAGLRESERLADLPHNKVVLLFTDGESNDDPPLGVLATYEDFLTRPGGLPCSSMHFFGFGYDLNATLLSALAERSRGLFAFIPDASMCGTVFINFVSSMFCVLLPRAEMQTSGVARRSAVLSLSSGQSADVVYDMEQGTEEGSVAVSVRNLDQPADEEALCAVTKSFQELVSAASGEPEDEAERQSRLLASRQVARAEFIQFLGRLVQLMDSNPAKQPLELAAQEIEQQLSKLRRRGTDDAILRSFELELDSQHPDQGQVRKACLQLGWYKRWGRHHLLSLARAHSLQLCHNFKDPSVQQYGGELFHRLQKRGLEIFKQIAPPPPSCAPRGGGAVDIDMDRLVDPNGGCIAGDVQVQLQDLSLVRVSELKPGMTCSNAATVRCVIEARAACPTFSLVEVAPGVRLTAWHPVRLAGADQWQFARDVKGAGSVAVAEAVYNVILSSGHSLIACAGSERVEIIALGHGIVDDPVAAHPYLGTQRVLDDIARCPGFGDGRVVLDTAQYGWTRDPVTQLIDGLRQLQ